MQSGDVTYEILAGATAEEALASEPVDSGVFEASRNLSSQVRVAAHALYIRLRASAPWSLESIRCITSIQG